ncbi:MAG: SH3 domain-containing protein, partial [Firmicutes bacterium]|nr:SH3 domain-containing protein [Bacillota bacterium]
MSLRKMLFAGVLAGVLTAVNIAPVSAAVWGTVTTDGVNLRTAASTDSDVAKVLYKGTNITVAGMEGSWYALSTANYGTAYIHSDFFKVTSADATVTSDSVNVRRTA